MDWKWWCLQWLKIVVSALCQTFATWLCAEYARSMRKVCGRHEDKHAPAGARGVLDLDLGNLAHTETMEESLLYIWRLKRSSRIKVKSYFSLTDTSMRRVCVNQASFSKVSFAESSMRQVCGNEKNERRRCQAAFCKKIVCGTLGFFILYAPQRPGSSRTLECAHDNKYRSWG